MRPFLIAGNWKMNGGPREAGALLKGLRETFANRETKSDILVCPPFVTLALAHRELGDTGIAVGAQNTHFEENGAYTGEISTTMLKESGCNHVIIGHSERREFFGENDAIVARKVRKAIDDDLTVILCVGEKLQERKSGDQQSVVMRQLREVVSGLTEEDAKQLVIAYEPVWAIGTGETASPKQAQEMHAFIRTFLAEFWSTKRLEQIRILYGGSMKPGNAKELLSQTDVDGGLIGGASLDSDSFTAIIDAAEDLTN